MKKLLLSSILLVFVLTAGAQSYHYIYHQNGNGNPGPLNKENDNVQPTASGWSSVMNTNIAKGEYSASQVIPFTFLFDNQEVTSFIVSSTGFITFSSVSGEAQILAEVLPSPNLPDKTVSIWGMNTFGNNDYIVKKTFGTAPNRQHWIRFMSMSTPNNSSSYTYWAIVLEETTNKIYVVEQYGGSSSSTYESPLHSIGIQIDGSTAISVEGSPTIKHSGDENQYTYKDNAYYEFVPGPQPAYDLGIVKLTMEDIATEGVQTAIQGTIVNYGSEDITDFTLNYSVSKGVIYSFKPTSIIKKNGGEYIFVHFDRWKPKNPGMFTKVKVWISDLGGADLDENKDNDNAYKLIYVNSGITTTKYTLIDEVSATWCGHCPDEIPYLNQINEAYGDKVYVAYHHHSSGGNTGNFSNPASLFFMGKYVNEYPNTMVDRAYQEDRNRVSFSRTDKLNERVDERVNKTAQVNVSIIDKNWNPVTREITFTVKAEFVDYTLGDMRIGAYVVEDKMRGVGNGYDQIIYSTYTGNPQHMFYKYKSPMVGYIYPNVVRDIPSGAFGTENSIPDNPVSKGAVYTETYTYVLPPPAKFTIPESSDFPPTGEVTGYNKIADITLVGFVVMDNVDVNKREIINITNEPIFNTANSINKIDEAKISVDVYPNPTSGYTSINFFLPSVNDVSISVINSTGKVVKHIINNKYAAGNQKVVFNAADLDNGVYFIKVETDDNQSFLKKFVVIQ